MIGQEEQKPEEKTSPKLREKKTPKNSTIPRKIETKRVSKTSAPQFQNFLKITK